MKNMDGKNKSIYAEGDKIAKKKIKDIRRRAAEARKLRDIEYQMFKNGLIKHKTIGL